jgi:uncharacterized protein (TIGR02217 family)
MNAQIEFSEERFPTDIAFGSSGGPERNTEIVTLGSGREHRNQRWAHSRRRYEAGYGVKSVASLHRVVEFFEARRGPLVGFRYRDPLDWKSCLPTQTPNGSDQLIGVGEAGTRSFQLTKTYGSGGDGYVRLIQKPVAGTVQISVAGEEKILGQDFSVDMESGIITFVEAAQPQAGAEVRAGFEFDVPVRFVSDQMSVSLSSFRAGDVPSIPIVEVVL